MYKEETFGAAVPVVSAEFISSRKATNFRRGILKIFSIGLLLIVLLFGYDHMPPKPAPILTYKPTGQTAAAALSTSSSHLTTPKNIGNRPATPSAGAAVRPNKVSVPAAPMCTKMTANFTPAAVPLDSNSNGLQQAIDVPQYYQVYGYSGPEVYQQIMNCTPVSEAGDQFAASTNYFINWRYSYVINGSSCSITSAAVGVHINQIYPQWVSSQYASSDYASRWQTFMNSLETHENGHRDLDLQYAAKLLNDLQSLQPTDCNSIIQVADNLGKADIAALDQANEAYDATTGHGASQGAVIPN